MSDLAQQGLSRADQKQSDRLERTLKREQRRRQPNSSSAVVVGFNEGKYVVQQGSDQTECEAITNGAIATGQRVAKKGTLIDQMRKPFANPSTPDEAVKFGKIKYLYATSNTDGEQILCAAGWNSSQFQEIKNLTNVTSLEAKIDNLGGSQYLVNLVYKEQGIYWAELINETGSSIWKVEIPKNYPPPSPKGYGFFLTDLFPDPTTGATVNTGKFDENYDVPAMCGGYKSEGWGRSVTVGRTTYKIHDGAIEILNQPDAYSSSQSSSFTSFCTSPTTSDNQSSSESQSQYSNWFSPSMLIQQGGHSSSRNRMWGQSVAYYDVYNFSFQASCFIARWNGDLQIALGTTRKEEFAFKNPSVTSSNTRQIGNYGELYGVVVGDVGLQETLLFNTFTTEEVGPWQPAAIVNTAQGSDVVSILQEISPIQEGAWVHGTGLAPGSVVVSRSGNSLKLDRPATSNVNGVKLSSSLIGIAGLAFTLDLSSSFITQFQITALTYEKVVNQYVNGVNTVSVTSPKLTEQAIEITIPQYDYSLEYQGNDTATVYPPPLGTLGLATKYTQPDGSVQGPPSFSLMHASYHP